jgi:hypothetical protein
MYTNEYTSNDSMLMMYAVRWCVGLCKTWQLCKREKHSWLMSNINMLIAMGEPYNAIEWIGVIMWYVNPHITNEMLICVNSKLVHVDNWILLISESVQSIWVWICRTCWIKFLEHTIVTVVIEIDNIVLLDYSNPIFRWMCL